MPFVTYVQHDGTSHRVDVPVGDSVMRGAVNNSVPGIVAECGGGMACATCHCVVDQDWMARVGPASEPEKDMLEFAGDRRQQNSRLSCQITVSEALDGLVVHVPEAQY